MKVKGLYYINEGEAEGGGSLPILCRIKVSKCMYNHGQKVVGLNKYYYLCNLTQLKFEKSTAILKTHCCSTSPLNPRGGEY